MRVWTNTTFRALDLLGAPAPDPAVHGLADGSGAEPRPALDCLDGPTSLQVQAILDNATVAQAVCILTRRDPGTRPLPIEAILYAVNSTAIQLRKPTYRPGQRSLAVGERVQLRIAMPEGTYVGESSVVARFEAQASAAAYAIARPGSLILEDRRSTDRVGVAYDEPPTAELLHAPTHKPIGSGELVDLSMGGVRVRAVGTLMVRSGDRVVLRAKVRDDVRIHAMGIVVHVGKRRDGMLDIGVKFSSEVPDVDRYLREISSRGTSYRAA
ncbi:MAG: PilZ domain-containing protein [Phycisphaerae bacterium]|nr:PilZ domain-containing protein [Phycisphaerae bacterium]